MTEEAAVEGTNGELFRIGMRAVYFQEFLIRRAWGFFYGVWAIDLLLVIVGSFFFDSYANLAFTFVAIISGYFVSTHVFGRARNIHAFRDTIWVGQKRTAPSLIRRYFLAAIVAYAATVLFVALYLGQERLGGYITGIGFLALITAGGTGIFFASLSGIGKAAPENLIASITLTAGGISEFIMQVFSAPAAYELLSWSIVISSWIVSALLSFYYASEVLGGLNGED